MPSIRGVCQELGRTAAALVAALLAAFALPAWAQNVIQSENAKTAGVTTAWQIPDASYASNQEIEGYASATSINRGESINLYVQTKTPDTTYTINVYRIGWYGGSGGRLVHGPITRNRTAQPACPMTDTSTRLIECNWTDPYVLTVPNNTVDATDWASGVYLAKLTGGSTGRQSYIIFVVRDDARPARAMFQTSVTTYAAYNHWGGYNFYDSDSLGGTPAHKMSFNRPYKNPQRHLNGKGAGEFLSWEINMLRFMEREGYDTKYSTNIDTHVAPARLLESRVFLSVGHDEYYTRPMYDAVEAARNAGVNLMFVGANAIYWQVRLEPSAQGQANRTVVGYKYFFDPNPTGNPALTTYLWREGPLNRPEAGLIGVMYDYNTVDLDMVIADCSSWVCAGTGLLPGSVLPGMLGYEVDRVDGSSPANISIIASSPYVVNGETRYSNVTYYTAASGAGVFATGSMQWTWGLDSFTPGTAEHGNRSNTAVQQITRNVLNRFTDAGNATPVITTSPVSTALVGTAYSYDVNATDANGDALTYALTQSPSGMSIHAGTGLISWLPAAGQTGAQAVTVRVSDPGGLAATQSFTINVSAGNVAPQITTTALTTAVVGAAYSYDVNASDANGDALTYALTAAPAGMSIDAASGLIAWTPTAAQAGAQAVTVRVSDPGGLFATQSFTVTVSAAGNVAPQVTTTAPAAATVGVAYSYDVNASDANGDVLTYALTAAPAGMTINTTNGLIAWTPTAAQLGSQTVTVRVSDAGGLFATQTFTITVGAGAAPATTRVDMATPSTYTVAPNGTVAITLNWYRVRMAADYLQFMHLQNAAGTIWSVDDHQTTSASWTNAPFSQTRTITLPAGLPLGTYDIRVGLSGGNPWTDLTLVMGSGVTDPEGGHRYKVGTLTVSNGAAPQITTTAVTAAVVGAAYSYDVNATDANGDVLTYALTTAPAGMTINASTGLIAWTPTAAQAGSQAVTVRVSDPGGLVATQTFTVTVAAAPTAPQVTTTAVTTATVGVAYSYDVNASDANGDVLTYALTAAPAGMSINASNGLIAWTPTAAQVGSQAVTVRVSDPGGLFATQAFNVVVSPPPNVAPQITTTALTSATAGAAYSYDVNASDANGDALTYALTTAPAGMSIDAGSGLIAWTPTAAQVGSQAVTVRVSDPGGLFATQSFSVVVAAAPAAPQITTTAVTVATAGAAYSYDVNATDANGDTLTYALTQSPAGMSINAGTGLIAWTPTAAQVGSQAVTVRVSDPGGLAATQAFNITVSAPANVAPQVTTTAVTTATVGVAYSYDVNATDANGDTLTYALTAAPAGMSINATSGLIAWTPAAGQTGSQAVSVRVSDPAGLAATQAFNITVAAANVAPVITTSALTTATVGVAYSYDVNATDANGGTLTYSLTTFPTGMTINASTGLIAWTPTAAQAGARAVTVRVADPGGLFATQSFNVTVGAAAAAPVITTTAVTTATAGVAYSYDVNATDANGDALTYALTTAPAGMSINASTGLIAWTPTAAQAGSQAVVVRVSDPGGLAATQSFTITVAGSAPSTTRVDLATPSSYSAASGATVAITLNWYRVRMAADYLQFMHLVNAAGEVWSVDDHATTSASWTNGPFAQTRSISLAGVPPGTYDIRVGLSGGNPWVDLALVSGSGVTDPDGTRRYKVGTLTVR